MQNILNQYITTRSLLLTKIKQNTNTRERACYNHIRFCIGNMTPEQWDKLLKSNVNLMSSNHKSKGFEQLKTFLSGNREGRQIVDELIEELKKC